MTESTAADTLYTRRHCPTCEALNESLCAAFLSCPEHAVLRRSHFFNGRYENIYITAAALPGLSALLAQARDYAGEIAGITPERLRLGFWFNAMRPGDVTLPHTHDDDDELLSAAYYLRVPARSGDLLIHEGARCERITPQPGMFVFFAPQRLHEVTRNASDELRLSLGINFGLADAAG
jgi:hypothetical protein